MTLTCTKQWAEIPFAHRQMNHTGHCREVHGHNWTFEVTFAAVERDSCGFVIDFGKLGQVKSFFNLFDHATVLAVGDPIAQLIQETAGLGNAFRFVMVPDPSSEGLASFVLKEVDSIVNSLTAGRVWVQKVTVYEDSRNSATCEVSNMESVATDYAQARRI